MAYTWPSPVDHGATEHGTTYLPAVLYTHIWRGNAAERFLTGGNTREALVPWPGSFETSSMDSKQVRHHGVAVVAANACHRSCPGDVRLMPEVGCSVEYWTDR